MLQFFFYEGFGMAFYTIFDPSADRFRISLGSYGPVVLSVAPFIAR